MNKVKLQTWEQCLASLPVSTKSYRPKVMKIKESLKALTKIFEQRLHGFAPSELLQKRVQGV